MKVYSIVNYTEYQEVNTRTETFFLFLLVCNQIVQGAIFEGASQTNLGGSKEDHLYVISTSGSHVLQSLQVGRGQHRGDDSPRATCQLYI